MLRSVDNFHILNPGRGIRWRIYDLRSPALFLVMSTNPGISIYTPQFILLNLYSSIYTPQFILLTCDITNFPILLHFPLLQFILLSCDVTNFPMCSIILPLYTTVVVVGSCTSSRFIAILRYYFQASSAFTFIQTYKITFSTIL